ncbi:hypothetical protein COY27_05605 [Candidatus Woesearchaeota archaeon CG_4_10_14_0_2_um_filter_33_13]|nr:MAG: hypothetical protein COY27_05605 [Candidatus Woesearchaeota archaeon CG_4_10_14_0_2_um_filter_33_13]
MIKKWLIRIAIVIGILIFLGILTYAQVFNFVLKPFSDKCGYNSNLGPEENFNLVKICGCDGFSFNEYDEGKTNTYCLGTCQECRCYEQVNNSLIFVNCEEVIDE